MLLNSWRTEFLRCATNAPLGVVGFLLRDLLSCAIDILYDALIYDGHRVVHFELRLVNLTNPLKSELPSCEFFAKFLRRLNDFVFIRDFLFEFAAVFEPFLHFSACLLWEKL